MTKITRITAGVCAPTEERADHGHEEGTLGSTEGGRMSRALRRKRLGYRRLGWRGAGNWVRTKASNAAVGSQRRRASSMRARMPTG